VSTATVPDWLREAVDLRDQGLSERAIAESVGRAPSTVHKYLASYEAGEITLNGNGPHIEGQTTVDDHLPPSEEPPPEDDPEYESSTDTSDFRAEAGEPVGDMPPKPPAEPETIYVEQIRIDGTTQVALDLVHRQGGGRRVAAQGRRADGPLPRGRARRRIEGLRRQADGDRDRGGGEVLGAARRHRAGVAFDLRGPCDDGAQAQTTRLSACAPDRRSCLSCLREPSFGAALVVSLSTPRATLLRSIHAVFGGFHMDDKDSMALATREAASAMREVAAAVDGLTPPPEPRSWWPYPRNPWAGIPGLGLAMRVCRYQDEDGVWHGLAEVLRRVPEEFVALACTIGPGAEVHVVSCACGATEFVAAALVECRGECGRFFVADNSGPWSIRLPQEADGG
jgi:hypothetical protein